MKVTARTQAIGNKRESRVTSYDFGDEMPDIIGV